MRSDDVIVHQLMLGRHIKPHQPLLHFTSR